MHLLTAAHGGMVESIAAIGSYIAALKYADGEIVRTIVEDFNRKGAENEKRQAVLYEQLQLHFEKPQIHWRVSLSGCCN